MSTAIESSNTRKARNTGDWRGLPTVLGCIAMTLPFLGFMTALLNGGRINDAALWVIFGSSVLCGALTYVLAAIIAALRGIVNK